MTAVNTGISLSLTRKPITLLMIASLFLLMGCTQKIKHYKQGKPEVTISGMNSDIVKKYEKFEVIPELKNTEIENPYDPDDIDVYAQFTSPAGENIRHAQD